MKGITPKIKKNIILLKGKNKLKKEKWKGLEVTLNYIGKRFRDKYKEAYNERCNFDRTNE